MMRRVLFSTALALLFATVLPQGPVEIFIYASAHADEPSIPSWVAASCCGPQDAHKLRADQIQDRGDSYVIEGIERPIPKVIGGSLNTQVKTSQDGNYWAFYRNYPAHEASNQYTQGTYHEDAYQSVYCLFVPMAF